MGLFAGSEPDLLLAGIDRENDVAGIPLRKAPYENPVLEAVVFHPYRIRSQTGGISASAS